MKIRGRILASVGCGLMAAAVSLSAQALKDACTLVTTEEVSAALGETVGVGVRQAAPNGEKLHFSSTCIFKATQTSTKTASVGVVYFPGDLTGVINRMPGVLKAVGMKDVHLVDGVGDGAVWASYGTPWQGGELIVQKGNVEVIVSFRGLLDEDTAIDRAKTLAGKALPRI